MEGEIGCFINRISSNFFFCSYDARISFNNLLPVLSFLLIVLFCILLRKCSLIWIAFCVKVRLGIPCRAISLLFYVFILVYYLLLCCSLVLLIGNIKTNPGPVSSSGECFSNCYWNLNSVTAHNYTKLSLVTAYNLVHSFDIICLSETYLNSETPPNNTHLESPGYNSFRSDHPSNNNRGSACIYYKSTVPLRILNISNLDEFINFEVSIANKICRFIQLYRSPSQKQDEFQEFKSNLEMNLDALSTNNPFLTVMIGDFNAKSSNWYLNDITSFEGSQIEFLASQFAMSQVINEPTHILDNSKSCIDLIFTSQPNMIMDSGVHPSLHSNCHHQIVYAKFDLRVFYPPLYERTVWHFSRANSDHIKKAINLFDWESSLNNLDVNEQVSVFNETIMNIMSNFVPIELVTCDDRDPPWMNRYMKNLIVAINDFHKKFVLPSSNMDLQQYFFLCLKFSQNQLIQSVHTAKQKYFNKISKRLCDPMTSTKSYWSL